MINFYNRNKKELIILLSIEKCDKLIVVIIMKKKFKEYRMFLVCLFVFMAFLGVAIYCGIEGRKMQMIGALMLSFIALFLLLLRYKIVLFDDVMMIYEWKIAAMLPTIIEYKDIQSIEKKSQHHVIIQHKRTSHIYIFNSDLFISTYESLKNEMSH